MTALGSSILLQRGYELALLEQPYDISNIRIMSTVCMRVVVHGEDFVYVEDMGLNDSDDSDDDGETTVYLCKKKKVIECYKNNDTLDHISFNGRYILNEYAVSPFKIFDTEKKEPFEGEPNRCASLVLFENFFVVHNRDELYFKGM